MRADGMAAYASSNYLQGVYNLGPYLRRKQDDREALLAYAVCRENVEEGDGSHLRQVVTILQRCVGLDPSDRATALRLLKLFNATGLFPEARDLAAKLLPARLEEVGPGDVDVLREEFTALMELKAPQAKIGEIVDRIHQLAPADFGSNWLYVAWLHSSKQGDAAAAHVERLRKAFPNDPRFRLLGALSEALAVGASPRWTDQGRYFKSLCDIAGLDPDTAEAVIPVDFPDADLTLRMVAAFDSIGQHTHALAVLRQGAAKIKDVNLLRVFARRAWQVGRPVEVIQVLGDLSLGAGREEGGTGAHTELLAFKAVSLQEVGRAAEAQPLVDAITRRTADFRARGWAAAFAARRAVVRADGMPPSAPELLAAVKSAETATRENRSEPVFLYVLGQVLASLGRTTEARTAWGAAADSVLSAGWESPLVRTSQTLLDEGRVDEAIKAAKRAMSVAPRSVPALSAFLAAQVAQIEAGYTPKDAQPGLLKGFEDAAAQMAKEGNREAGQRLVQIMLPGRVILLVRAGRVKDAEALVAGAVADASTPPDLLQRLALICARENLGQQKECLAAAERAAGSSGDRAAVAATRSLLLAASGRRDEGTRTLAALVQSAPKDQEQQWRLAMARYLDAIGDPGALAAWKSLVAAFPDSMVVRQACLASSAAAEDLAYVESLSKQVAAMVGADEIRPTLASRLARARALVQGPVSVRARDEAVAILRGLAVEAHDLLPVRMLLVRALLLEDSSADIHPDLPGAIEQLRAAVNVAPDKGAVALQLARVLIRKGDLASARTELERVGNDDALPTDIRLQAVDLLMAEAQFAAAAAVAATLDNRLGDRSPVPVRLRLADAYARTDRDADALRIYRRLAEQPPDNPDQIFQIADGLAFLADPSSAEAVLRAADGMSLPAGAALVLRARFAQRHSSAEAAMLAFEKAVEAAPDNADCWAGLARFLLARDDRPGALEVVRRGLERLSDNPQLLLVRQQAMLAGADSRSVDLKSLAETLERNPATRDRAQAVRAVEQLRSSGRLGETKALVALADQFQSDVTVQLFVVRELIRHDPPRTTDAAAIVRRLSSAFPATVESARIAVAVYRAAGDWQAVSAAATLWRQLDRSPEADAAVGESMLETGNPAGALDQVEPRVPWASANLDRTAALAVLAVYGRSLVALGRQHDAAGVLGPLLSRDASFRRQVWLPLAGLHVTPESDARVWVAQVQQPLDTASPDDQMALAAAWSAMARRFQSSQAELSGKAVEILRALAGRPGTTIPVMIGLSDALRLAGDGSGAVNTLRQAVQEDPGSAELQLRLAVLVVETGGDPAEAVAAAEKAAAANPTPTTAIDAALGKVYERLAARYAAAGSAESARQTALKAAEAYRHVRREDPADLDACLGLAVVSEYLGDFDTMVAMYDQSLQSGVISSSPVLASIKNNLAYALLRQGQGRQALDRARALVREAIEASPVAAFYDTLGSIEAARGARPEAIEAFRKAVSLDPLAASPTVELIVLLSRGDKAERHESAAMLSDLDANHGAGPRFSAEQIKRLSDVRAAIPLR